MIRLISAFFGTIFLLAFYVTYNNPETQLSIGDDAIEIEVAKNIFSQQKGLSGRENLDENKGMLFVYDEPNTPSFWMKDMKFSIDIIWIDENNKIVGIEKNINPNTYPRTFSPSKPILNVLEVNAGWSDAHNVEIGEEVKIN